MTLTFGYCLFLLVYLFGHSPSLFLGHCPYLLVGHSPYLWLMPVLLFTFWALPFTYLFSSLYLVLCNYIPSTPILTVDFCAVENFFEYFFETWKLFEQFFWKNFEGQIFWQTDSPWSATKSAMNGETFHWIFPKWNAKICFWSNIIEAYHCDRVVVGFKPVLESSSDSRIPVLTKMMMSSSWVSLHK